MKTTMKTIMRRTMKAILMNNDIPNEINLGSYTWNKIIKDGYVSIKNDCSEDKKAKCSFRKINLPDYFYVLENRCKIITVSSIFITFFAIHTTSKINTIR